MDGWKMIPFLLGQKAYFQVRTVSFRVCRHVTKLFDHFWHLLTIYSCYFCLDGVCFPRRLPRFNTNTVSVSVRSEVFQKLLEETCQLVMINLWHKVFERIHATLWMCKVILVLSQIIATSHDLTPNGGLVREIPLFQGNPGWWNIIIWPD